MSQGLTYHLSAEERKGKCFLSIEVRDRGVALPWGPALFQRGKDPQEQKAIQWLLREQVALPGEQKRLYLSGDKAKEGVSLLSLTRQLHWGDRKIFFDPFTQLSLVYRIHGGETPSMPFCLRGEWQGGGKKGFLEECDGLCPFDPPCLVHKGALYFCSDAVDAEWYARVYPQPLLLDQAEWCKIEIEWKAARSGVPERLWEGGGQRAPMLSVEPLPYLVLTDRTGAFARLWMDYGALGRCEFEGEEGIFASWRHKEAERGWERDLLETDFCRKWGTNYRYYTPLDRVGKSLSFLLEIGWTIFDYQGRRVFKASEKALHLESKEGVLYLKGKIRYENHEAALTDVVGAFNRREQFLSLDPHSVGLLDDPKVQEICDTVGDEPFVGRGIEIRKGRAGLLQNLWPEIDHSVLPESLAEDISLWMGEKELSEQPPSDQFQGHLFPYQQKGVDWLCLLKRLGLSGLLSDEMGLGKTVQVLAFLSLQAFAQPVMIVAPTSLLFNWQRELKQFLPHLPVYLHHGPERICEKEGLSGQKVILTSYALLRLDKELLQSIHCELIILDEGQMIKNAESQGAQAVFGLSATMRLILSGTPIENRWEDLWSLFHFLMPELLEEKRIFAAKMAVAAVDARHLMQTRRKIHPFLLRRKKEEVAVDLPEKMVQTVWVDMPDSQRMLYEHWLKKQRQGLLKKEGEGQARRMEILEAILRLRQLCCHPWLVDGEVSGSALPLSGKMERMMADLEEVVAEGGKVLIYSQFTQMLRLIESEVKTRGNRYVYLDGATKEREAVVRQFQEDPETQIFLISLKAGGVGLNLTAADYVFLYDPWWNEAVENQAIDRAHRVGRRGQVIARRYVTALSIEEKLMTLKERKRHLSDGLFSGDEALSALTMEDLQELLTDS